MGIYESLGVSTIINAAGTYTVLGGSRMSERTLADMAEAARSFVSIRSLQQAVHQALAELTNNESAYICNGAASGIYLSMAACIEKKLHKRFFYVNRDEIQQMNVVMFKAHRNPYDLVIGTLGLKYRELAFPNIILPPEPEDLSNAIDQNTVAVFYVHSGWVAPGYLPLEQVIQIADRKGVPVIVDAAAQLPPVENLWRFSQMGAAFTLFSGGKDLKGPQSSGLVVGPKSYLDILASIGFPNYGIGRMLKVGREEIVGLYSAVKQYVEMDHAARLQWCEEQVQRIQTAFTRHPLFFVTRSFPNEAGQPIPRAFVELKGTDTTPEQLCSYMRQGTPSVYVNSDGQNGIFINPMSLTAEEIGLIIQKLSMYSRENAGNLPDGV